MWVTTTARGMPTAAHSCHSIRVAPSITPPLAAVSEAEMTNRAASAARRPARSSPTKSAWPGVSIRFIRTGPPASGMSLGCCAGSTTVLATASDTERPDPLFDVLEIADGGAVLDRAGAGDRAGRGQHGLDQGGLAGAAGADQDDIADLFGRLVTGGGTSALRHAGSLLSSCLSRNSASAGLLSAAAAVGRRHAGRRSRAPTVQRVQRLASGTSGTW